MINLIRRTAGSRSVLLALFVATAYLIFLIPGVSGDKDSAEFTVVLGTFGMAHATGYPIYTIAGSVFVAALGFVGIGPARGAGAWSALGGIIALLFAAMTVHTFCRWSRIDRTTTSWAVVLAIWFLAANPLVNYELVHAEVYSWHLAWTAGVALLFARIVFVLSRAPTSAMHVHRMGAWWGFAGGLGAAHHATAVLTFVPLSCLICWRLWRRRLPIVGPLFVGFGASLIPFSSYLYIAYRCFYPNIGTWPMSEPTWAYVWGHMTGSLYRQYLGGFTPEPLQLFQMNRFLFPFLVLFLLGGIGGALACRGAAILVRIIAGLGFCALLGCAYAFSYAVYDPASYFLAPLLQGMMVAVVGLVKVAKRLHERWPIIFIYTRTAFVFLILALTLWWGRYGIERRAAMISFDLLVRDMFAAIPENDPAIVAWPADMIYKLVELQVFEGAKPNVELVNANMLTHPRPRREFIERHGFDPLIYWGNPEAIRQALLRPSLFGAAQAEENLAYQGVIHATINKYSPRPVIIFDPILRSVRKMNKDFVPGIHSTPMPPRQDLPSP
jgi:hypothetical protein